ncbi:hypothetical protein EP331_00190 [bacterium]|nr:MAG: hypothetical protein EP331_00190 [bacterium]
MGFFELTTRFRLIDIEGVLLDSAGDALLIREPEDIGETKITLKRNPETHGVYLEYSDAETPFIFDRVKTGTGESYSGYDLIKAIFESKGIDGQCQFQIQEYDGSWSTIFLADLDFGQLTEIDYAYEILARRVLLGDKFRVRKDIPIDFSSSTSIDGDLITGISHYTMFLHSKALQKVQRANSTDFTTTSIDSSSTFYVQWDFRNSTGVSSFLDTLNNEFGQGVFSDIYTSVAGITANFIFTETDGELVVKIDADYDIIVSGFNGETLTLEGVYADVNGTEIELLLIEEDFIIASGVNDTHNVAYSVDARFNIPTGASVKIYENWTIPTPAGIHSIQFNNNTNNLATISLNLFEDNSTCSVYLLKDALSHAVESIVGDTGIFESSFLDDYGTNIFSSNGYLIRGFSTSDRPMRFSFEDLFSKQASPIYGLGYSLMNDSGTTKCYVERYSFFYADLEVLSISNIVNGTYSATIDNEVIFNKITTGYSEIPSSTDENKTSNLDEYNTINTHITPIQRVKGSVDYISSSISSGYKIENQRREQFKNVPSNTVSDDDKLFIIHGITSDTYTVKRYTGEPYNIIFDSSNNLIKLYGTYFDIGAESITLAGSGMTNAGSFTVSSTVRDGGYLVLTVGSVSTDENFSGDYTLTLAASSLRAARDDEFDTVSGVIDPKGIYNGGINPKYMLFNNSPLFNSGFNYKSSTELVKTQDFKLNGDAQFKFKSGQGSYILDPQKTTVQMDGNLQLSSINRNDKLFGGRIFTFQAAITYDQLNTIKDALTDYNDSKRHGYISFIDPNGNTKKGFPISVTYSPLGGLCEFVLREKYEVTTQYGLVTSQGYILMLSNGDLLRLHSPLDFDEFSFAVTGGYSTQYLACLGGGSSTTLYNHVNYFGLGSRVYSTLEDRSSVPANGWYTYSGTQYHIVDGLVIDSYGCVTQYSHSLVDDSFLDASEACGSLASTTTFYSEDSTLIVGSVLYTTSYNPTTTASAGWYKYPSEGQAIELDSSGEIITITSCGSEYSYSLKTDATKADACSAMSFSTYYSEDATLIVGSILYTVSGNPASTVSDAWYSFMSLNAYRTVSGEIVEIQSCAE